MSYANGFSMTSTSSVHDNKPIKLLERDYSSEEELDEKRSKKKKKTILSDSEPSTDDEVETILTSFSEFSDVYTDLVDQLFGKKEKPTAAHWKDFIAKVKALQTKLTNHTLDLVQDISMHVIGNMYATAHGLTTARWEKARNLKPLYQAGDLPRYVPPKIKFDEEDRVDEEEKNALFYLKLKGVGSQDLACALQDKCESAGFFGNMSMKNPKFKVYENFSAFDMFLCDTYQDFIRELYPAVVGNDADGDEPVGWQKDVFENDSVLRERITRTNAKVLERKLGIRATNDNDMWFQNVRTEIAKKCGGAYIKMYPNTKRNEENRPVYTRKDMPKMRAIYQKTTEQLFTN